MAKIIVLYVQQEHHTYNIKQKGLAETFQREAVAITWTCCLLVQEQVVGHCTAGS